MDQHFLHHHHHQPQQQQPQQHRTRYATLIPQSPHHHHHHLPPPPALPLPPPPPPISYRTVHTPPPPTYNPPLPHKSPNFPFYPHRPNEEERPVSSISNHHALSNRNDLPRHIIHEPAWNPSPDDRVSRKYPPPDFDRESHHHYQHRPLPPPPPPLSYPPVRYDRDGRLKTERHEGNPRESFEWGRSAAESSYHRHVPSGTTPADSNSGGYRRAYADGVECDAVVSTRAGRVETRRWVNDRKGSREVHNSSPSFEFVNDETKREYHGSEIVRYSNSTSSNNCRGNNRERGQKFTRTPPKKQIQKKSALLRIQTTKPNHHRNRDVERYVPDNFFRGKDQHKYFSGHGMKEEDEREGSPVEVDISFESNSLVAKAIVAAPSTSSLGGLTDTNLENSKKVSVSEAHYAGSPPAKLSHAGENLSYIDNTSQQKNVVDNCPPQPCASATTNPHEVAVSVAASDICSGKWSSKVVKKKKVVKRVVKKGFVNPKSTIMSSSRAPNAVGGTVQANSVTLSSSSGPDKTETWLEEKSTVVDKVYVPDCLQSLPNEGNILAEDKKGGLSLSISGLACRSQECKTDEDSDFGKESRFEPCGNISNSPSRASTCSEDKNSASDCLDAFNSVHDLLNVPNIDNVTKSLNVSTSEINHMDYENMQLCQEEVSLSLGKYTNVGCSENRNLVDVGDEMNHNVISTGIMNAHNFAGDRVYGFNSNDLSGSENKFTDNDSGNNDIVGKVCCDNMAPTITRYAILEGKSDTDFPLPSGGVAHFSSSGNTKFQDGQDCLHHTRVWKQGSDSGLSNVEDCIIVHDFGIMKDVEKQVPPGEVTIFHENSDTNKTFPNSNTSVGYDERDTNKIKRKVRTHLSLSLSSNMDCISPDHVNPVSHANDVDRGSSQILKDPSPSEFLNHSVQNLDFDSQCNQNRDTALKAEFYVGNNDNDDANEVSPVSKRKKGTDGHLNLTQCLSETNDSTVATTSNKISEDNQARQKDDVALLSIGIPSNPQLMSYLGDIANLSDRTLTGGSFESMVANKETMSSKHLELQHSDMVCSLSEELAFPHVKFSVIGCEQQENITPTVPISTAQFDILVNGNIKGEKTESQAVENIYQYKDDVQRSPRADVESNSLIMKDDSLAHQNLLCSRADDGVTTSNSDDELIEDSPDALSDMRSQGVTSELPDRTIIEYTAIHVGNICGNEENANNISIVKHGSASHTLASSKQHTVKSVKSDYAIGPIMRNTMPEPTQVYSKVTTHVLSSHSSELNRGKNQPDGVSLKNFPGHSFAIPKSKTKTSASSIHISKPRTWHRTSNSNPPTSLPRIQPSAETVPPKRQNLERKENFQNTSYIRKGNSLVRKPTLVSSVPQISSTNQSPLGLDEIPKSPRSESRADVTDPPTYSKTVVSNAPQQRQRIHSISIDTKSEENISSPLVETPSSDFCENASDHRKFIETNDTPDSCEDVLKQCKAPENQTVPSDNGESQVEANNGNVLSLNSKRIVYIKPKTNQLVATSNSCDFIVSSDDKSQRALSDGYYKKSKNQLVRTTFESHVNKIFAMPNKIVTSDGQGVSKAICNKRYTKRRSHKVTGIFYKSSRASLVWKNSSGNGRDTGHYQKVIPHLFPWKRATYLRSFIHNSTSSFNSGSLSAVSKNLLLLRKRDTVYTRSTRGFSLWKSKVLGVGGSSLKWSKSIEKHSKKANEEATLAVAAVERKKREQKDPACIGSQAKRERIFRIGSVRYRMDPSRRTLQRVSDDESLPSASICSGLAAKRAYIPRRLVIGNDEYVRIGNGNKLIRDPKKRTRKLANEKVRWSLHTARQRLARKQKYCQFFTRFGKCNKDGGKCPYIHDPSKIAVCTKFLNGLCSTSSCNLTHKVIPERMPDCSYFLQGLCSNRNCPYRHVNVNPTASICEGFLKGYCADGNECRKKHSYVCPSFEATGTCTQGTKCKLHHPKKQSQGKKRKRPGDQNNNCRGRYFDISEPGRVAAPRHHQQQDEEVENDLTDYISLDVTEEAADTVDQSFELSTCADNDPLNLHLDTCDVLIKPIFLLTKFASQSQSSSLQA